MNPDSLSAAQSSRKTSANFLSALHWIFTGIFLVTIGLVGYEVCSGSLLPRKAGNLEALLLISATACTLTSLSRRLPGQNVLLAAVIIAVLGGAVHALGVSASLPFGPFTYTRSAGLQMFNVLPWTIPLLWVVVILNSRGVARLMMRPWRKMRAYGFWVIGLTAVLCVLFDLGLEPFATLVRHFWLWDQTRLSLDWYGTPITNFVGWFVTSLLILAFASPSLVNKQPSRKSWPNYHPLMVWVLLNLLFVASFIHNQNPESPGAIARQLWMAAGFSAIAIVTVIIFAVRGARW